VTFYTEGLENYAGQIAQHNKTNREKPSGSVLPKGLVGLKYN
jgi:hypothetical protein